MLPHHQSITKISENSDKRKLIGEMMRVYDYIHAEMHKLSHDDQHTEKEKGINSFVNKNN